MNGFAMNKEANKGGCCGACFRGANSNMCGVCACCLDAPALAATVARLAAATATKTQTQAVAGEGEGASGTSEDSGDSETASVAAVASSAASSVAMDTSAASSAAMDTSAASSAASAAASLTGKKRKARSPSSPDTDADPSTVSDVVNKRKKRVYTKRLSAVQVRAELREVIATMQAHQTTTRGKFTEVSAYLQAEQKNVQSSFKVIKKSFKSAHKAFGSNSAKIDGVSKRLDSLTDVVKAMLGHTSDTSDTSNAVDVLLELSSSPPMHQSQHLELLESSSSSSVLGVSNTSDVSEKKVLSVSSDSDINALVSQAEELIHAKEFWKHCVLMKTPFEAYGVFLTREAADVLRVTTSDVNNLALAPENAKVRYLDAVMNLNLVKKNVHAFLTHCTPGSTPFEFPCRVVQAATPPELLEPPEPSSEPSSANACVATRSIKAGELCGVYGCYFMTNGALNEAAIGTQHECEMDMYGFDVKEAPKKDLFEYKKIVAFSNRTLARQMGAVNDYRKMDRKDVEHLRAPALLGGSAPNLYYVRVLINKIPLIMGFANKSIARGGRILANYGQRFWAGDLIASVRNSRQTTLLDLLAKIRRTI